jgi:hypothetical protein
MGCNTSKIQFRLMVTSIEQLELILSKVPDLAEEEKQTIIEDAQVFFDFQAYMLTATTMEPDGLESIIAMNVMAHMEENKNKITSTDTAVQESLIAVAKFATKHGFTESDKLIEKGLLLSHKITEMNKRLKK